MRRTGKKTYRKKRFAKRRIGKVTIPRSMVTCYSYPKLPDLLRHKFILDVETLYTSTSPTMTNWNPIWCPWFVQGGSAGTSMTPTSNGSLSSFSYSTFAGGWIPFLFLYGKHQIKRVTIKNQFCLSSSDVKLNLELTSAVLPQYAAAEIYSRGSITSQPSLSEMQSLSTYPASYKTMLSNSGGGQNIWTDTKAIDIAQFMDMPLTSDYSILRDPSADVYSVLVGNSLVRSMTYPSFNIYQRMPTYCWTLKSVDSVALAQPINMNVRTLLEFDIEMSNLLPLPTSTIYCPGGVGSASTNSSTSFQFSQRTTS